MMIDCRAFLLATSLHDWNATLVRFVFEHFLEIFLLVILWNVAGNAWLLWRRARKGLKLPKPGDADVVFVERSASGRSHKSFLTRLGGASNTLTVIVTGSDLAITSFFPAFVGILDLEHVIPRNKILKIEERGEIVDIEFLGQGGAPAKFTLRLRKMGEFLQAIGSSPGQPSGIGHAVPHDEQRA